jgi:hypothetical protein
MVATVIRIFTTQQRMDEMADSNVTTLLDAFADSISTAEQAAKARSIMDALVTVAVEADSIALTVDVDSLTASWWEAAAVANSADSFPVLRGQVDSLAAVAEVIGLDAATRARIDSLRESAARITGLVATTRAPRGEGDPSKRMPRPVRVTVGTDTIYTGQHWGALWQACNKWATANGVDWTTAKGHLNAVMGTAFEDNQNTVSVDAGRFTLTRNP